MSSKDTSDETIRTTDEGSTAVDPPNPVSLETAEPVEAAASDENSSVAAPDGRPESELAREESSDTPASESGSSDDSAGGEASSDVGGQPDVAPNETKPDVASTASPRRLRLNPTNQDDVKAVPSLGTPRQTVAQPRPTPGEAPATTGPPADSAQPRAGGSETPPESPGTATTPADGKQPEAAPPQHVPSAAPVELPPKVDDLDAELEAEINAALSQSEDKEPQIVQDLEGGDDQDAPELEPGTKLKGTVQTVGTENVFVELGFRSPGILQLRQFETKKPPKVGQSIEVIVDRVEADDGLIVLNLPRGRRKVSGDWNALTKGQTVDCMVSKTNKGGLEVSIGNLRGFLPAGQVDLSYVSDLEPFVGQKLTVQITEVNPRKRNLVVSRRAHLEVARKEAEKELWKTLEVGQKLEGRVKTLKDYGAFIDLGGTDGFLHIGEISWQRIKHPSDALQEGQEIEVTVLQLDPEKKKISLGMRQLTQNPWLAAAEKYAAGSPISGTVTRTSDFGAFVELEPGIEGLIHISELDYRRVKRVTEVVREGQQVEAQVLEVDPNRRRISLSLKALKPAPESETKSDEDLAPGGGQKYERKRKTPLKGGTGGSAGGGLFGNPGDFKK